MILAAYIAVMASCTLALAARWKVEALLCPLFHYFLASSIFLSNMPDKNANVLGILYFVSSLAFLAGYRILDGKYSVSPAPRAVCDQPPNQCAFLAVCVALSIAKPILLLLSGHSLFSVFTRFYASGASPESAPSGVESALEVVRLVPFYGLTIGRLWIRTMNAKLTKLLWWILLGAQVLVSFASGTRGYFIAMILSVFLADLYLSASLGIRINTRRYLFYGVFALICLFLISFLTTFRTKKYGSFPELMRDIGSLDGGGDARLRIVDHSISINNVTSRIVDKYLFEPAWFEGVWAQILNPIPRSLLPDKPVGFGKAIVMDEGGPGSPRGPRLSLAAGIVGESVYNAGPLGVLFFSFAFGMVFAAISRLIAAQEEIHLAAVGLFTLAFAGGMVRGDWLSSYNLVVYNVFFIILALKIIRSLLKGKFAAVAAGGEGFADGGL